MKYDIRIINAKILDGTGRKAFSGEMGIKGGRIKKISGSVEGDAKMEIDAKGHILSPGFIDLHTHCAPAETMNYLQQGVTTVVSGNCGFGYGRIGTKILEIKKAGKNTLGPNFALLAGHNTIRMMVLNRDNRAPSRTELKKMKDILKEDMQSGAFGFSTGLAYVPGAYSKTDELIELTNVLRGTRGFYVSHIRNEGAKVVDSVKEVLKINRETGVPVHISHHKVCGVKNWGKSRETIALIKKARSKGIDITLDQYPYTASCGTIQLLMPTDAGEGSPEDIKNRIMKKRKQIKEAILRKFDNFYDNDFSRIVFVNCVPKPSLSGKTLADAVTAFGRKMTPDGAAETALDIIHANPSHGATMMVSHSMSEEEVEYILQYPETCVASDGWTVPINSGHPHPRLYGTFPRVLGYYAREKKIISIEDAVKKMTKLPADRLCLKDRGVIKEDTWADVAVWNEKTVIDKATFDRPHKYPAGIDYVIVNGRLVLQKGKLAGDFSGVFLQRQDK
ncbi:MAG TPA: D-aminoacylase [bacterium]|nr:D-aminoacylase [bacterium]